MMCVSQTSTAPLPLLYISAGNEYQKREKEEEWVIRSIPAHSTKPFCSLMSKGNPSMRGNMLLDYVFALYGITTVYDGELPERIA